MSRNKSMLLRVQSSEGTRRIEIRSSATTCQLFEAVHDAFDLNSFAFALYKEKNRKNEISSSKSTSLLSVGLHHGDMIYLAPVNGAVLFSNISSGEPVDEAVASTSSPPSTSTATLSGARPKSGSNRPNLNIKEDDVDIQLMKTDGKIQRPRDDKLCRHNNNSRCVHCSSLEPFDESYLKEHNIKHLSFHSYLRKMMSGVDRGKFLALEDISCRIKEGCKDHPPWPKGICSKCQPNAITLNMQAYRHVDNVTFENTDLVERFLNYWRITGHQRIGFLYGYYEIHSDVPLGIKANVAAIYEPPQASSRDTINLLPDDREEIVEQTAASLGLRRVGWIFTDLLAEDVQKGTVKYVRNIDSHLLSSQECIMAGHFQNIYPNYSRYASKGIFGSKFVTVCVTGDKANQVHMEGYQVSNQCMALVRDNCLLPTKDCPELGYVRESSDKQYVPDVFYKEKDSYGNEVSRLARPLPVEYLLVDVPASTPVTPQRTFNTDPSKQPFPVENRLVDGHIQDFNALSTYLSQFAFDEFLIAINDFHLLLYISTMEMLPMREYIEPLLTALRNKDKEAAEEWSRSEHWATLEQLIAASSPPPSRPGSVASGVIPSSPGGSSGPKWTCPFCTFLNNSDVQNCEMCNLPRSSRPH
ncbi:nuclear protein localization protein 4 homolog [Diorhabda sublineata]|uniref:nuclear protein localization protein 4 homolog n=1 Tax=Diorhabda sublineata TaxID=1163346 RepID=UPI0024E105D5|nr:nuclear protein localization protein 4 homolog [Diorhabda sublineata]